KHLFHLLRRWVLDAQRGGALGPLTLTNGFRFRTRRLVLTVRVPAPVLEGPGPALLPLEGSVKLPGGIVAVAAGNERLLCRVKRLEVLSTVVAAKLCVGEVNNERMVTTNFPDNDGARCGRAAPVHAKELDRLVAGF